MLVLVTPPASEPLSPADVRLRLGLDASIADDALTPLIKAARQEIDGADGWLGRALVTQTWDLLLDCFPASGIDVPLPPLQSVGSVKYIDANGDEQTWGSANYQIVAGQPGRIIPAYGICWPATRRQPNAVTVRFAAGYGAAADVPEPIRQALAEKVSLARSMSRPDPTLRSETVEGIGSQSFSTGQDFADSLRASIDDRLRDYRIWV